MGKFNFINWSVFDFKAHSLLNKADVCLFHVGGSMTANKGNQGVITQSPDESFQSVEYTFDLLDPSTTKVEDLDSTESKVNLAILWDIKVDFVLTAEPK